MPRQHHSDWQYYYSHHTFHGSPCRTVYFWCDNCRILFPFSVKCSQRFLNSCHSLLPTASDCLLHYLRRWYSAELTNTTVALQYGLHCMDCFICNSSNYNNCPVWGRGTPLPPCPFTSSSFLLFTFSFLSIGFTYFLLLSITSLSTRIVPLHFQAGDRRRRPNLGLVCLFFGVICIP